MLLNIVVARMSSVLAAWVPNAPSVSVRSPTNR